MVNHYVALGVRPDADSDAIKSAYRSCVRRVHPDVAGDGDAFRILQAAVTPPPHSPHWSIFPASWVMPSLSSAISGVQSRLQVA